jgi:GNAT superfamily N-acetyltransferase
VAIRTASAGQSGLVRRQADTVAGMSHDPQAQPETVAKHADATTTRIRTARLADVPAIVALVRALAEYEKEPDAVEATEEHFRIALFPDDAGAARSHALVAEVVDDDGHAHVVGMAVWYVTFSTWTGRHGIWLEDLFVRPEHRGGGLGAALLARLAGIAVERGYRRLEWWVLRWNEPSIAFYNALGATPMDGWLHYRVDGEPLLDLAARDVR